MRRPHHAPTMSRRSKSAYWIAVICCSVLACASTAAAVQQPSNGQTHAADSGVADFKLEALMPEHATEHEEAYLCTSVPLPDRPLKLVGIEPLSSQEVVHHMLLFGASLLTVCQHRWHESRNLASICQCLCYNELVGHLTAV